MSRRLSHCFSPDSLQIKKSHVMVLGHQQHVIVILGCHRAGTSLLTNILHTLGMQLSNQLLKGSKHNERGYFESERIVKTHDALLQAMYASWHSCETLMRHPVEQLLQDYPDHRHTFTQLLKKAMLEDMAEVNLTPGHTWGFKDPRTVKFLGLWDTVFEESKLKPVYIVALRHPDSVVRSLHQRGDVVKSPNHWYLLWIETYVEIVKHFIDTDEEMVVIDYDAWFDQPEKQTGKLLKQLDFLKLAPEQQSLKEVIVKEARHQIPPQEEAKPESLLHGVALELYNALKENNSSQIYMVINMLEFSLSLYPELREMQ